MSRVSPGDRNPRFTTRMRGYAGMLRVEVAQADVVDSRRVA